jgi:hypothetical protein
MADSTSLGVRAELSKVLESEHADLLRGGAALILREVMELEVGRLAGAERYERTGERDAYRNGYRPRRFDTRVGTLELEIRKLRSGPSYLPSFLEARTRRAGLAVGRDRGLCQRRLHPKSRAPRRAARGAGHLQVGGEPHRGRAG